MHAPPQPETRLGAGSLGGKPGSGDSPSAPLLCPGWMLLSPCERISSFALFSMLGWRVEGSLEVFILNTDAEEERAELGDEEKFGFSRRGPYFAVPIC